MAREYYCSYCGTALVLRRKALKNRAIIVDLVDPHDCDERNLTNITDSEKPISPIIKEFQAAERRAAMPVVNEDDRVFFDQRPLKDRRELTKKESLTSAPLGLMDAMKSLRVQGPERTFSDLDVEGNVDPTDKEGA